MAGPALGIVTPEAVGISDAVQAASRVGVWQPEDVEGHGLLDDRPILFAHEDDSWVDHDRPSLRALHAVLGWVPCERQLEIVAMSNQSIDHRLVAQVALAILSDREGAIDYSGPLDIEPLELPGWALHLRYQTALGGYAQSAIVSTEWLAAWLADPAFRLIK